MSRLTPLAAELRAAGSKDVVRKARKAARMLREDPRRLAARVTGRPAPPLRQGPGKARGRAREGRLVLSVDLPVPAERGYLVLERRRGFEEKDFIVTAALQDPAGHGLKPGRAWKYSHSVRSYYVYPTDEEGSTVTVPFTATGAGAARVQLAVQRWDKGATAAPEEAFGAAWLVYAEARHAGADAHRVSVAALRGSDAGDEPAADPAGTGAGTR